MLPETIIKDCLFEYVQIILRFEKALRETYKLVDNPYQCQRLFPRTGTVTTANDLFEYRFHGSGCSFTYSDLEIHYDYNMPEEDYITTVPWKFWHFVTTFLHKKGEPEITIDEVDHTLEGLNDNGIIQKIHPDYLRYQISFLWFEAYTPLEHYI